MGLDDRIFILDVSDTLMLGAISESGRYIASCTTDMDDNGILKLIDRENNYTVKRSVNVGDTVLSNSSGSTYLQFFDDDTKLIIGTDLYLKIYNVNDFSLFKNFSTGHSTEYLDINYQETYILTMSYYDSNLINTSDYTIDFTLNGTGEGGCLNDKGKIIISNDGNGYYLTIHDIATNTQEKEIDFTNNNINQVWAAYDEKVLLDTSNQGLCIFNTRTNNITSIPHSVGEQQYFINQGDYIFITSEDQDAQIYRTRDMEPITSGLSGSNYMDDIFFNPKNCEYYIKVRNDTWYGYELQRWKQNVYFIDWKGSKIIGRDNYLKLNFQLPKVLLGETDIIRQVKIKNSTPVSITNISVSKANLPTGLDIKFSKTESPFDNLDSLNFSSVYSKDQEQPFYIQVSSTSEATKGIGNFDLKLDYDFVN